MLFLNRLDWPMGGSLTAGSALEHDCTAGIAIRASASQQ